MASTDGCAGREGGDTMLLGSKKNGGESALLRAKKNGDKSLLECTTKNGDGKRGGTASGAVACHSRACSVFDSRAETSCHQRSSNSSIHHCTFEDAFEPHARMISFSSTVHINSSFPALQNSHFNSRFERGVPACALLNSRCGV